MTISDFKNVQINPAIAYVVGLMYPLINIKEFDHKVYVVGSVNHNIGMITQNELFSHRKKVKDLLEKHLLKDDVLLLANNYHGTRISVKMGFSVLIDIEQKNDKECCSILDDLVQNIAAAEEETKKYFLKGCFDGRSSYDTTIGFLAIDVDRDYSKQDRIALLLKTFGINPNLNRRKGDYKKNDQIRIKPEELSKFMSNVGLLSDGRLRLIEEGNEKRKIKEIKK